MTTDKGIVLKTAFESFFCEEKINNMALELGVCQRRRKIEPAKLMLAQVLAISNGAVKTLEDIRLFYCRMNNVELARSSFHEYLSPELGLMMKQLVNDFCENNCQSLWPLLPGEAFTDMVIQDSSLVTLHDKLERKYPSCRFSGSRKTGRKRAAVKVHIGMNPLSPAPRTLELTSGRAYDADYLKVGEWVRNTLLLFDRGYCKYKLFHEIVKQGGYFITRYQKNFNPPLIEDCDEVEEQAKVNTEKKVRYVSDAIRDATAATCPPKSIDYKILATDRYEKGGKRKKGVSFVMRFVGVWNEDKKEYHCYFTNLPADLASAEMVGVWYGCRWDIEMQFKELKTYFKLDQVETSKDYIVESLLYAALLGWLLCRWLHLSLLKACGHNRWDCPSLRFAVVFLSIIPWLLHAIRNRSLKTWRDLQEYCIREMKDPWINRKRNIKGAIFKHGS